jgi:hypothetical protein
MLPAMVMSPFRGSRYFVVLAIVWVLAMTWHIYPQFRDTIRVEGRLTTVSDYLEDICGQRLGAAATACLGAAHKKARVLLRREQGKSILLIDAPLFGYLLIYLPARLLADRIRRDAAIGTVEMSGASAGGGS